MEETEKQYKKTSKMLNFNFMGGVLCANVTKITS
jgi:hypothetical protein